MKFSTYNRSALVIYKGVVFFLDFLYSNILISITTHGEIELYYSNNLKSYEILANELSVHFIKTEYSNYSARYIMDTEKFHVLMNHNKKLPCNLKSML